ncbi:PerC family transcriptional regulator [Citrobacter freundii]|uniref:PerC family transcriptional regulator n=1 Tax=Citrobacter freundii TaxID=546 RepID=UPI0017864C36|nr:PerC family transcriptional regulator [Citrobacter freundii]MBE0097304.1 PerC family transcriptional regulator [Citrobacter freundii]
MIRDKKAEELEAKGLYRRAAARWLEVMALCADDIGWEQAKFHRERCLDSAKRPPVKMEEFGDLHKAARETQKRMGISKPDGEAFRLPVSRKRTQEGRKKC